MSIDEANNPAHARSEELVQTLRAELEQLAREAQEKHAILQTRNEELVRVKADLDRVQARLRQIVAFEMARVGPHDGLPLCLCDFVFA